MLEFLPANRDRIEAELNGMVERWREAGRPRDADVRHPFGEWAAVVGGILRVNGFAGFLENSRRRRTADDPVRRALGLLGASAPDDWRSATDWVPDVTRLGLARDLVTAADRDSQAGLARGLGVVMAAHEQETFTVETDDERLVLRLERARRRDGARNASVQYQFVKVSAEQLSQSSS